MLVAVAAAGLVAGIVLAFLDAPAAPRAPAGARPPTPARAPTPPPTPTPAPTATPAPTRRPFHGVIDHGLVAYLRCDGVPQRPGPFPCPRDRALENAAWAAVDTLRGCADGPLGIGEADMRIEYAADQPPDVRVRPVRGGTLGRADAGRIVSCIGPSVAALRPTMRATRLIVSFRFALTLR